jgi:uncharacterized membrane protein (UPF0127 family)
LDRQALCRANPRGRRTIDRVSCGDDRHPDHIGMSVRRSDVARLLGGFGVVLVVAIGACGRPDDSSSEGDRVILPFDTARIRLLARADTLRLVVELAVKPEQHTLGLMERRQLPDSAGMLFLYDATQPDSSAYWMYRTLIPLDIAYIDSAGTIRSIRHMEPCRTMLAQGCPTYPAGAPFRAALEVNAGYFARHAVQLGDRVILADTAKRLSPPS